MELPSQEKLLLGIARILDKLKIKYFITGGFAVSVWGRPRATFDIDIVVKIVETQAGKLVQAWRNIYKTGYADEDAAKEAIRKKSEFNFIDPGSGMKVDFWVEKEGNNNPPEFGNRKIKKISGQNVFFISPEDLILNKLQWYKLTDSTRQLEDIQSVLKISKPDMEYVKKWAEKQGTIDELEKLL